MSGFSAAMDAAPPLAKRDVVKGGGGGGGDVQAWLRVVPTKYEGAGRWHLFCGDVGLWPAEAVHFDNMRRLPEEYRDSLPFQAILADLAVDPPEGGDDESGRYPPETLKFLNRELMGVGGRGVGGGRGGSYSSSSEDPLNIRVSAIVERPEAWPRFKMTLSSIMREDKPECVVKKMVNKKLAKLKV